MAHSEDNSSTCMWQEGDKGDKTSQLTKIHQMIQIHDNDYKISRQIDECMIDDGLTLDILSHCDEK